ncbi:hypothetical protein K7X08_021382 [Anisodus acutangulus]|uniref:Protein SirB1 N-terminal domain-containing protein n=1 Tax=Anisodus acutangulus TaxID=402998 RepID=A0A9Q1LZR9_9SOLA|nr:hypothetical protein K7X08_021382 [Anisodus acutangulus]
MDCGFFHLCKVICGLDKQICASTRQKFPNPLFCTIIRYGRVGCWIANEKGKWNKLAASTKARKLGMSISPMASSGALAETRGSSRAKFYKEVLKDAREKFTQEISFQSKDRYFPGKDEAFMAFNREMDAYSLQNERRSASLPIDTPDWKHVEAMPLAGKNMSEWMSELDSIAREVEAELVTRDIGCHLVEVLDAVNVVLYKSRGFKRSSVIVDLKCSYLHLVLSSGYCSAILLSVIYIEVCRRLNLTIVGSRIGEEFLIWPQTGNPEELFKVTSGHSLFGIVNGKRVDDPKSSIAIHCQGLRLQRSGILSELLWLISWIHWKRAARANHGLMLTSPLRSVDNSDEKFKTTDASSVPLLRPQDLRLAIMASQRLLILQPHNWALRRDHGMMLYYSREYEEAVQELSICMAFAPEEEAEVLEAFVEKLHLLRVESSWKNLGRKGRLTVT